MSAIHRKTRIYLTAAVALAALPLAAPADTIRVPGDQPTIQAGIDVAVNGDVVLIADGVYTGPDNKNLDFAGKAITVRGENGRDNCIIDCEQDGRAFYFHSGEGPDSVVQGLTIRNGRIGFGQSTETGGGILCIESSPTIEQCAFESCSAELRGGAINCERGDPRILGCLFVACFALGGSAVALDTSDSLVFDCEFTGNTASEAALGGVLTCLGGNSRIVDCSFTDNSGGALSVWGGTPLVRNCDFVSNRGKYQVAIFARGGRSTIERCRFVRNSGFGDAGAIMCLSYTVILDCEFRNNGVLVFGAGAVRCLGGSLVRNCTFVGNRGDRDSGGGAILTSGSDNSIANCIFWENTPDQIRARNGSLPLVTYCVVQGGWPGEGNIDLDPRFVDLANGDLHLLPDSPAIDAGSNALVPQNLPFDLDGLCRIMDGDLDGLHVVDMGVYELAGVIADCNANGVCDWIDITNGESEDCNRNAVPDACDIANGTSLDCNGNGIPDECDIAAGFSEDCNTNGVPDECDIANGTSRDINGNGIPDVCEAPLGDVNCDLFVNALDIEPFIVALFEPENYPLLYPHCDINLADINGNGVINSFDIEPFLDLLFGP